MLIFFKKYNFFQTYYIFYNYFILKGMCFNLKKFLSAIPVIKTHHKILSIFQDYNKR